MQLELLVPWKEMNMYFQTWKTVEIGELGNSFRALLSLRACSAFAVWADWDLINYVKFERTPRRINLALVSLQELGVTVPSSYGDVCYEAMRQGLRLCPAEAAISLMTQERGELCIPAERNSFFGGVHVGMLPIMYEDRAFVFRIGGSSLRGSDTSRFAGNDGSLVYALDWEAFPWPRLRSRGRDLLLSSLVELEKWFLIKEKWHW